MLQTRLCLLLSLVIGPGYSLAASSTIVRLEVSGQFSSNPDDIVIAAHPNGPFPISGLLGGTFSGTVDYSSEALGSGVVYKAFRLRATNIDIFDNTGSRINTITLSTGSSNPLLVGDGFTAFNLGPSGDNQQGWVPRMPTDLRFRLLSSAFKFSDIHPPGAAVLNSATLDRSQVPYGPFVELDDAIDHFSSWDLPITSLSYVAQEVVPEPNSFALLSAAVGASIAVVRRRAKNMS